MSFTKYHTKKKTQSIFQDWAKINNVFLKIPSGENIKTAPMQEGVPFSRPLPRRPASHQQLPVVQLLHKDLKDSLL